MVPSKMHKNVTNTVQIILQNKTLSVRNVNAFFLIVIVCMMYVFDGNWYMFKKTCTNISWAFLK